MFGCLWTINATTRRCFPRASWAAGRGRGLLVLSTAGLFAKDSAGMLKVIANYNGTRQALFISSPSARSRQAQRSGMICRSQHPVFIRPSDSQRPAGSGDIFNVYAFISPGTLDWLPSGTQPMGGVGPFPFVQGASSAHPSPSTTLPRPRSSFLTAGKCKLTVSNSNINPRSDS